LRYKPDQGNGSGTFSFKKLLLINLVNETILDLWGAYFVAIAPHAGNLLLTIPV
jgi:hypothetical protein